MSDRMKDQYFESGELPGFLNMTWRTNDSIWGTGYGVPLTDNTTAKLGQINAAQGATQFLPDNSLMIGNFTANRPMELYVGPTADDDAPLNFTGKFAKTWKEKDPSARQYLLEWSIMPVITRPDQFIYVEGCNRPHCRQSACTISVSRIST